MATKRKTFAWFAASVGILGLLLLAFMALAPRLINLESVRDSVVRMLSQKVGVGVELTGVELSYLPWPHIDIHQAKVILPGGGSGILDSVAIYPRIMALLQGKLKISRIEIESPILRIPLPQREKGESGGLPVHLLLAPLNLEEPDLEVELRGGSIELFQEDGSCLSFSNLALDLRFPPEGVLFRVSCISGLWERFFLSGRLNPQALKGEANLDLRGLRPQGVLEFFLPGSSLRFEDSLLKLAASFSMDGLGSIQAEIQGSLPEVTVIRTGHRVTMKAAAFSVSAGMGEEGIRVSLKEMSLGEPGLHVSGGLILGGAEGPPRVRLEGRDLDIPSIRETVQALAGDGPGASQVFDIVRGGKVPSISLQSQGTTPGEVLDLSNLVVTGRMEQGRIFVPGAGLDLHNVSGDVAISKGMLEGAALGASLGNSRGEGGALRLGLLGGDVPFHLEIDVDADLTEVPPVLKRFVANRAFLRELEKIHELQGRAKGRLVLGETTSDIKVRVEAHPFELTARCEGIPFPVKVRGGWYSHQEERSQAKDLRCQVGNSTVEGLSWLVEWREKPQLAMEIRDGRVSVDEIFSWVSSVESLHPSLQGTVHSLKGEMILPEARAKGPLLSPDQWQVELKGEVRGLHAQVESLPGPVGVVLGRFAADEKGVVLKEAQASILDSALNVSGRLHGTFRGLQKADLNFSGHVGPKSLEELPRLAWGRWVLTAHSPLSIQSMGMTWDQRGAFTIKGDLGVRNDLSISLDVSRSGGHWAVHRVRVKDDASDASFSFRGQERALTASFSGRLSEKTLGKIFPFYQSEEGWMQGDFRVHAFLDKPLDSSAEGRLEADDFTLVMEWPARFELDRVALTAKGKEVEVEGIDFVWAETKFSAGGSLGVDTEGPWVNLDVSSSLLDWEQIKPYLPARGTSLPGRQKEGLSDLPLRGEVRLHADRLTAGGLTWHPLKAEARLGRKKVEARVTEARVCGISTLGSLGITPEGLSVRFEALGAQQDVLPCVMCLTDGKRRATGVFDLKLEVRGTGKEEELLSSLQGALAFSAKKGFIHEYVLFERVNHYLSLTGALSGRSSESGDGGIPFDSIVVKAKIANGRCAFEEAVFDGADMDGAFEGEVDLVKRTIDGTLLVAPFRTMDRIVRFIPGVRTIMGGTLVSIPIQVSGPLDDPKLSPLAPSAIGTGLVNLMKRTFNLPVEIFNPLIYRQEKDGSG